MSEPSAVRSKSWSKSDGHVPIYAADSKISCINYTAKMRNLFQSIIKRLNEMGEHDIRQAIKDHFVDHGHGSNACFNFKVIYGAKIVDEMPEMKCDDVFNCCITEIFKKLTNSHHCYIERIINPIKRTISAPISLPASPWWLPCVINVSDTGQSAKPKLNADEVKMRHKFCALLRNKTAKQLSIESRPSPHSQHSAEEKKHDAPCHCGMSMDEIATKCGPFQRISVVLEAYDLLQKTMQNVKLFDICQQQLHGKYALYDHKQLFDDFAHIKVVHIDGDNDKLRSHDHWEYSRDNESYINIGKEICQYFENTLKCEHIKKCKGFGRHYAERGNGGDFKQADKEIICTEDAGFRAECDKIHVYFLHSSVRFGIKYKQISVDEEACIDELNRYKKNRSYCRRYANVFSYEEEEKTQQSEQRNDPNASSNAKKYIGKKEDDKWWDHIQLNDGKQDEQQDEKQIYRGLVQKMGAFRWQNPHGFEAGQNQGISQNEPAFKNIKEEALQNEYEPLSKDNWNQTLRKSEIFFESWARQRIRTSYKGYFEDQVTKHSAKWDAGETIEMKDIVTLKLYTDFDKLQFELKQCFRFETFDRILQHSDDMTDQQITAEKNKHEKTKKDLENRLRAFYHWRGQLLIVLNKFGTKLNSKNNMILYHGVNAKMIIHPTQTYAFNGPLSTTSSYHVARTFATAKGMVLKITSYFPRLNYCNAFDASLLSDYPEEQEYLVGFMYVRLLKIRTRKLVDCVESFEHLLRTMNLSSLAREVFFAVHLFKEQIFSMSEHLERIQAQFLKVNRNECCDGKVQEIYNKQYEEVQGRFNDKCFQPLCIRICAQSGHNTGKEKMKGIEEQLKKNKAWRDDIDRNKKIFPIMCQKFNEFRATPNLMQRVRFDKISDHLKRFFMRPCKDVLDVQSKTSAKRWFISFVEITTVYPNVREIHFINAYRFDEVVLGNLIQQIQVKGNPIQKIVFLYYNYKKTDKNDTKNKPSNMNIFKDPDNLDGELKEKLINLGWIIKHGKNDEAGYKIRVYNKSV